MSSWSCYRARGSDIPADGIWGPRLRAGRGADRVQALTWLDRTVADDLRALPRWRSDHWQPIHASAARALDHDRPWQHVVDVPDWTPIAWALIPDGHTEGAR